MTAIAEPGALPPPPPLLPASGDTSPRGVTRVSDAAASSIAMRAASEVDGVVGASSSGISALLPGFGGSNPPEVSAQAHVHDDEVMLELTVGIEYPRPLRATLERLAAHLAERMREYGGLRLERLDISVAELSPPVAPPRPRVR